ncbi:hypothetical protein [Melittangium boletus]|uniref:hypothetical protein n=1 Tax=Melittangium boletus TaxID=83453 RepID=UPI003DA3E3B5
MRTWMRALTGVGVSLLPLSAVAQSGTDLETEAAREVRRTVLLAQPGMLGQVGVGVERALGTHVALAGAVTASVNLNDLRWGEGEDTGFSSSQWGLGVDPGVHVYLAGRAPEGLWVGPHVEVSGVYTTSRQEGVSPEGPQSQESGWRSFTYGASARVGYTLILSPGFSAQLGAGLMAQRTYQQDGVIGAPLSASLGGWEKSYLRSWSVAPRMTLAVGWAF